MNTCHGCGATVSTDYARVFGDNDDVVHECRECSSYTDVSDGSGAGLYPERSGTPPVEPARTAWHRRDVAIADGGSPPEGGDRP